MKRDLVINVLLIIAGVVLAIVLFGAGAIWRSRTPTTPPKTSLHGSMHPFGACSEDSS